MATPESDMPYKLTQFIEDLQHMVESFGEDAEVRVAHDDGDYCEPSAIGSPGRDGKPAEIHIF